MIIQVDDGDRYAATADGRPVTGAWLQTEVRRLAAAGLVKRVQQSLCGTVRIILHSGRVVGFDPIHSVFDADR